MNEIDWRKEVNEITPPEEVGTEYRIAGTNAFIRIMVTPVTTTHTMSPFMFFEELPVAGSAPITVTPLPAKQRSNWRRTIARWIHAMAHRLDSCTCSRCEEITP